MHFIRTKIIYKFFRGLRNLGLNFNEGNDPRIREMRMKIHQLDGIKFKIEIYHDNSWTAESTNIDGIITGSKNIKDRNDNIRDAIFTYFEIPPHLCNDQLIRADNEEVTATQRVYA